jgi:hypothetical protein
MTIKTLQKITSTAALALGLGMVATSAQANYSSGHGTDCGGGGSTNPNCSNWSFNNTKTNTQIGVTATASGWSNTAGGTGGNGNTLLDSAYVTLNGSSGLGVRNDDCTGYSNCNSDTGKDTNEGVSPEHAIDNQERVDSILFTFSEKVNLTSFDAGWAPGDSDFTVLAYLGDDGALNNTDPNGLGYADLLNHGWKLIGNYNDYGTGAHDFANSTYSSYWLIGASNQFLGGVDPGDDYFKLISLAGCTCDNAPPGTPGCGGGGGGVPEPGTILLMGAGLLGLTRYNKRRARA